MLGMLCRSLKEGAGQSQVCCSGSWDVSVVRGQLQPRDVAPLN